MTDHWSTHVSLNYMHLQVQCSECTLCSICLNSSALAAKSAERYSSATVLTVMVLMLLVLMRSAQCSTSNEPLCHSPFDRPPRAFQCPLSPSPSLSLTRVAGDEKTCWSALSATAAWLYIRSCSPSLLHPLPHKVAASGNALLTPALWCYLSVQFSTRSRLGQ